MWFWQSLCAYCFDIRQDIAFNIFIHAEVKLHTNKKKLSHCIVCGAIVKPEMNSLRSEVEGIYRLYLNAYVPSLQREGGVVGFFRFHRGYQFVSSALMDPISKAFIRSIEQFAKTKQVPLVDFS